VWEPIAGDPLMQFGLIVAGIGAIIALVGRWLFRRWGLLVESPPPKGPERPPRRAGEEARLESQAPPWPPVAVQAVQEEHRRSVARPEVGPSGSLFYLPDGRRVALRHRDYRALGEAGQYLLPGTVLLVQGLLLGETARTSSHLLEVMGFRVAVQGPKDS
jgi:hypothetical protein